MKSSWLIPCSLAANIVLASWCWKSRPLTAVGSLPGAGGGVESSSASTQDSSITQTGLSGSPAGPPAGPRWKNIQSRDLAKMIERLRTAGCPEESIQDLILAEVNRDYAARIRALGGDFYQNRPYWAAQRPYDSQASERREAAKKQRQLQKEKSEHLVELLGIDPEKQRRKEDGLPEVSAYSFIAARTDFLPESKKEAANNYLEQFEEKMQDFYRETSGMWDSQSRAEQRQLEAERLQGLAQILTPQEVREYDLRNSQIATQLSRDLNGLSISREQYEAIFDLRKKYGDSIYNYGDTAESKTGRDQVEENKKALNAELAETLGADFAKEYSRSQDYTYQQLARLAKRNDLPADTAASIYDLKTALEESAKTLRDNANLGSEQRKQALQEIRAKAEASVKFSLGDTVYQKYLNNGGYWIQNLAPGRPARP
jgi:hypothetical protein